MTPLHVLGKSSLAGLALVAVTTLGPAGAMAEVVARISYHWAPSHESAKMVERFAAEVNKRGAGKVKIQTFPSGQLYKIRQITGALSAGSVEMGGVVTHNQLAAIDKDWNIVQFPGFFNSIEHQRDFFNTTPEGKDLRQRVLKKTGLVHIAYVPVGPYATFSAKSKMDTVASMAGLKARSLAAAERPGMLARKMDVISLATEEIYPALQSGMIDTLATVPTAVKAYSWWEYLKFAQLPYAVYADSELLANAAWFNGLPKDVQEILLTVGKEISKAATDNAVQGNNNALKELVEKHGGTVTVLKGAALEEFQKLDREKTEPALAKYVSPGILAAARRYIGRKD
ncbi:MAG: TRAP transporter substrate-binding protein [Hyphomicrobiaceae bacterium]